MRITDLVNLLIPPAPLSRVRSAGGASTDGGGSLARQFLSGVGLAGDGLAAPTTSAPRPVDGAEFSTLAQRRAAGKGQSNVQYADAPVDSTSDPLGTNTLGGVVENYIRRRAILTYTLPSVGPSGASFSLTFDIESATRTIRFVPPGTALDTTG